MSTSLQSVFCTVSGTGMRRRAAQTMIVLALAAWSVAAVARPLPDMMAAHDFAICAADDDLPFSTRASGVRGFHVEIAQAIAARLGVTLKIDWIVGRDKIKFTNCDALMGSAAFDDDALPAAKGKTDFLAMALSKPYMTVTTVLASPASAAPILTMAQLKTLHVAVPSGSLSHMLMHDNDVPVWVRFRNDAEILDAVVAGKADAGAVSQVGLGWYQKQHPTVALVSTDQVMTAAGFRFDTAMGLRRTSGETVDRMNAILGDLRDDGTLAAILARYGVTLVAPKVVAGK